MDTMGDLHDLSRDSLFEGLAGSFVNSESQFDQSVSRLEFTIQSQIFTRDFLNADAKKKKDKRNSKHLDDIGEPHINYNISIGGKVLKTWNATGQNWDPYFDQDEKVS